MITKNVARLLSMTYQLMNPETYATLSRSIHNHFLLRYFVIWIGNIFSFDEVIIYLNPFNICDLNYCRFFFRGWMQQCPVLFILCQAKQLVAKLFYAKWPFRQTLNPLFSVISFENGIITAEEHSQRTGRLNSCVCIDGHLYHEDWHMGNPNGLFTYIPLNIIKLLNQY